MPASTPPFAAQSGWAPASVSAAERAARHALIWSIGGLVVCCFPLSIVGLVLGLRSRKLAAAAKEVVPATSTIAIAISSVVLLVSAISIVSFSISFTMDQIALSERVKELTARVSGPDAAEQLAQETACDLAELRIRTDGWKGDTAIVIDGFDCPGQVAQKGSDAELPEFSFNTSSNGRVTVTVCYKRGARWTVKAFREGGEPCLDPPSPDPSRPE